jgi:hypothetical protein
VTGGEEGDDCKDYKKWDEDGDDFDEKRSATARGGADGLFVCGAVKEAVWFGGFGLVVIHALF